jgi:hypothetical protein
MVNIFSLTQNGTLMNNKINIESTLFLQLGVGKKLEEEKNKEKKK